MAKLSDTKIRGAKTLRKPYKLFDGDGLFLLVRPNGSRWWRQRYRWGGKEQLLSLGTYPEISLATARARGAEIRRQVANDINPSIERQSKKAAQASAASTTLKAVTLEWISKFSKAKNWSEGHIELTRRRFELNVFPWHGGKPIAEITHDDILSWLQRIEDRHAIVSAYRLLTQVRAVFRYALKRRYVKHNPAADLEGRDILPRARVKAHASIKDPAQLGPLLRAIDGYHGHFIVKCALQFLPLVFVRPGELRNARWSEFNLAGKEPEWRIPAERMKMREQHIVPLSSQAVDILRELQAMTGPDGYVFPNVRNAARPISDNTLNAALRACGYGNDQQTAHGFRSTASTLLNEQQWNRDAIERQLAHGERDKIRGSYNFAEHLPERRRMMQAWSDFLAGIKAGAKVVAIKRAKGAA
jgi:integrase